MFHAATYLLECLQLTANQHQHGYSLGNPTSCFSHHYIQKEFFRLGSRYRRANHHSASKAPSNSRPHHSILDEQPSSRAILAPWFRTMVNSSTSSITGDDHQRHHVSQRGVQQMALDDSRIILARSSSKSESLAASKASFGYLLEGGL